MLIGWIAGRSPDVLSAYSVTFAENLSLFLAMRATPVASKAFCVYERLFASLALLRYSRSLTFLNGKQHTIFVPYSATLSLFVPFHSGTHARAERDGAHHNRAPPAGCPVAFP